MSNDTTVRLRQVLGERGYAALADHFAKQLEVCQAKVYNEEGIPMLLVLEDLRGDKPETAAKPGGDPLFDYLLACAFELAWNLMSEQKELEPADVNRILEVLAAYYFAPARVPETPP